MTRERRDHVVRTVVARAAGHEAPAGTSEPAIPAGPGCTTLTATRAYIAARCAYLGKPATLIALLDPITKTPGVKHRFWRTHWYNAQTLAVDGDLLECGEGTLGAPLYWIDEEGAVTCA